MIVTHTSSSVAAGHGTRRGWRLAGRLGLLSCLVAGAALAEPAGDLQAVLTARTVTKAADGTERFTRAEQVRPGDLVQYEVSYTNTTTHVLRAVQATLPIPAGMDYQPDSARPVPATASTDGKTFRRFPLQRSVTAPDGTVHEELVPAQDYRALRWTIAELKPHAAATVSARARVSAAPALILPTLP